MNELHVNVITFKSGKGGGLFVCFYKPTCMHPLCNCFNPLCVLSGFYPETSALSRFYPEKVTLFPCRSNTMLQSVTDARWPIICTSIIRHPIISNFYSITPSSSSCTNAISHPRGEFLKLKTLRIFCKRAGFSALASSWSFLNNFAGPIAHVKT